MPTTKFDWTDTRIAFLQAHYRELGAVAIADRLGLSIGAVTGKAYRMGLTNPSGQPVGGRAAMRQQQVRKIITQMEAHVGKRGDAQEIADRIAARKAQDRTCAWREVGNGFQRTGKPCKKLAVPGRMWCECHQEQVDALRAVA